MRLTSRAVKIFTGASVKPMRWLVFFVALVALLIGLLLLPQPASTLIILLLLLLSLVVALNRAGYPPPARYPALLKTAFHRLYQNYITPLFAVFRLVVRINLSLSTTIKVADNPLPSTRKSYLQAAELAAILLLVAYVTRPYYQSP